MVGLKCLHQSDNTNSSCKLKLDYGRIEMDIASLLAIRESMLKLDYGRIEMARLHQMV